MTSKILLRRGTAAQWTSANPTLGVGELGIETDTLKIKVGNGSSTWTQLTNYINVTPSGLSNSLGDYILLANQGNAGGPAELDSNGDLLIPENSAIFWNDPAYSYTTTLTTTQPTANRVITFPNATGTVALTSDITSAVTNLINAAPSTLDTLNELAAAINNDSSFSTTVNNLLNGKVSKSGGDTITASTASTVGLIIKGATSQTANLLEFKDSSGLVVGKYNSSYQMTVGSLQATVGDVQARYGIYGGGTGYLGALSIVSWAANIPTAVLRGYASQTANLTEWQNSAGTVLAKVDASGIGTFAQASFAGGAATIDGGGGAALGAIYTGSLKGSPTAYNFFSNVTGSPYATVVVKQLSGQTTNLQEWQTSDGNKGIWIDGNGQLETAYFFTNFGGGSYKNSGLITVNPANNIVPLVIAGAVGQTSDLQQWRNNSGTVLAYIDKDGQILTPRVNLPANGLIVEGGTGPYIQMGTSATYLYTRSASNKGLIVQGSASQTANLQEWQNSSGTALARIKANGNTVLLGALTVNQSNTFEVGDNYGIGSFEVKGTSFMIPRAATGIGLIIRGFASQTANLQEWQNSAGTILANINPAGVISGGGLSISTSTNTINAGTFYNSAGTIVFNVDTTNNAVNIGGGLSGIANSFGSTWGYDSSLNAGYISFQTGIFGTDSLAIRRTNHVASGDYTLSTLGNLRFSTASGKNFNFNNGNIGIATTAIGTNNKIIVNPYSTIDNLATVQINTNAATNKGLVVQGYASQTANLQEWQDSAGTVKAFVRADGYMYSYQGFGGTIDAGQWIGGAVLTAKPYIASQVATIIRGVTSQTADLQQWQNSNGTVLLSVSADGTLNKTGTLNIGPVLQFSDPGVGNETKFNFQKTNDSAYLIVKEKATDQTYYEFGMWDNALDSQDYFQWFMGQWSGGAGYGWMPLQLGSNTSPNGTKSQTLRFTGEQSVFWSPILTGSNTPYYTTNPNYQTHQDFEVTKGWAYTSNSTNIPRVNASGGATLNIDLSGYTYASRMGYRLTVDAGGTTFSYTTYGGDNSSGSAIAITGGWQTLSNGTKIKINGTAAANDDWQFLAFPTPRVAFGGSTDTTSLVTIKPSASDKGLVVRAAASPTVSIQEWQNSSGTVLANIDSTGRFLSTRPFRTDDVITAGSQTATLGQISAISSTSSRIGLVVQGAASQTADLQQWQTSTGQTNLSINFGGALQSYIQTTADNINSGITSFIAKTSYANVKPMIVMGAASQTANLQEWQDSAGTIKSYIASDGSFSSSMDATINSLTIGRGGGNQISNVAIGLAALLSNTTGVGNTQIGLSSGQNITTGSYNVGVGNYTNLSLTTGTTNTSIGTSAGSTITTGSNITVLGYDAEPSSPTISNEITLGNANVTKLRIPGIGVDWTSSALNIGSNRVLTTQDEKNIYITDSGTARTLGSSDAYKILEFTSSSSITVTIPNDASDTTFPIGSYVEVRQMGGGQITVSATSPATLVATDNQYKTRVQYSAIVLEKRASNAWYLAGDTTA